MLSAETSLKPGFPEIRKVCVYNLGCKVNAYESQAMEQLLSNAGYELVPFEPGADVYVINTCSVTNIADRKSRQMLHRARKMNPDAIVVAAGCYAQADEGKLVSDGTADLVVGNNRKQNIVEALQEYEKSREPACDLIPINHTTEYEPLFISEAPGHSRAFVKVQDGCSQFCSYCIIPYTRGRVRSREPGEALREMRALAEAGYREIVLTGIHLSSYGVDSGGKYGLIDLVQETAEIPGIRRIRLGSLEPLIITEDFAERLAGIPEFCPHFHLSLQSGCDRTLQRMNRKYRTAEYREKCEILRGRFDHPALTTDIITGFPGETEEDFEESLFFVSEMRFFETHVFPYSRRKGTRADRMAGQVSEAVKKERSARLLSLNRDRQEEFAAFYLGKELEVLLEEEESREGQLFFKGHSREYLNVLVRGTPGAGSGDLVRVRAESLLQDLHCNLAGSIIQ